MKHPLIDFPATPNRRNWGRISDMSHDLYKEKMGGDMLSFSYKKYYQSSGTWT